MNHSDRPFAVGISDQFCLGIEGGCIHVVTDRKRGDDLASVGIHDGHKFVAATNKYSAIGTVHRHAARRGARSRRPALLYGKFTGVDLEDQALIFQVVVDEAIAIRRGIFGSATKINGSGDLACSRINGGGAVTTAVEGEDPRSGGVENNCVWFLSSWNIGNRL